MVLQNANPRPTLHRVTDPKSALVPLEAAPVEHPDTVKLRPGRNGGSLKTGNPGNKGGGQKSAAFLERCARVAEDERLWAEAREKDPNKVLWTAAAYVHGVPKGTMIGAQLETPEGYRFTLILGERD